MGIFDFFRSAKQQASQPVKQEPAQPKFKIWVVCDDQYNWHKIVSSEKPYHKYEWRIIGPIDTELNAEELADRLTASKSYAATPLVSYAVLRTKRAERIKEIKHEKIAEEKPRLRSVDDEWQ